MVFFLLAFMVIYIFSSFYRSAVDHINEIGAANMKSETALIENYLAKSVDVLWVTADTVNYMMKNGASSNEILQYLTEEARHETEQIDENFTGIYGYIGGEYLDGIGWTPPEDYVPTERVWYTEARKAGGKIAIVPPYLDAQTDTVMFSVSQLLSDGESVVALDIALNEVQSITENMTISNTGYGFIVDSSGLVIAHFDEAEKGKVYPSNEEQRAMMSQIYENAQNHFEMTIGGERCTVFSNQVMGDWYVVMVVSNTELFHDLRLQMLIGIVVSAIVFLIIVVFCAVSARRIDQYQFKEHESQEQLERLNMNIIRALAYTIDAKDRYTSGHSQRVADYSLAIAKRMGKSPEEQEIIYYAALLHDVGKIRVSEEIINKPGKLTDEEYEYIKLHPVSGYHILKEISASSDIAIGAKYHHERYDGKGYPNGLEGENIPEIARILSVADAYDAMSSNRCYRKALPQDVVRAEIVKGRGTQFDPYIAGIMLDIIDEDKDYRLKQNDEYHRTIAVVSENNLYNTVNSLLNHSDCVIEHYTEISEALYKCERGDIGLLLLDNDMDGISLKAISEKLSHLKTSLIVMCDNHNLQTVIDKEKIIIDDYIVKPLNSLQLNEMVHSVLN